ncbi:cobyrinate a,c-diamide synthase [Chloroflexota bacterium]
MKEMQLSFTIAAPRGQSGKTIISTGLCAAFTQRGLVVQPFKKGPDYIDPSWLTAAAGRSCRNIDTFMIPEEKWLASFHQACIGVDLAIVEGAMGLYDSLDSDGWGSTAHISRILKTPVILVVNTTRMARSIAAMVMGYQKFEPETDIAGVILNNVSGSRHEQKLRTAVEHYCGIPVLGGIPRDDNMRIPQRHLGIVPQGEAEDTTLIIEQIRHRIEDHLDLPGILAIAGRAGSSDATDEIDQTKKEAVVRIGVMLDKVFTFYYPENLEALTRAGADLVFIDSLQDQKLPDIDGLFLGGGFPELFLEELEANHSLRGDIAQTIEGGLPVYAECAGLMYLCSGIHWNDERHEMVGVIHSEVEVYQKPQGHGYVEVEVTGENPLFPIGLTMRGHEFHYSRLSQSTDLKYAYDVLRGHGIDGKVDAIVYKNVLASYTHLHTLGVPQWAEAFVSLALREKKGQPSYIKT